MSDGSNFDISSEEEIAQTDDESDLESNDDDRIDHSQIMADPVLANIFDSDNDEEEFEHFQCGWKTRHADFVPV